jgi:chromosome segregation protein
VTPNPLYQALVRELEAVMPPRVASRVLREGLAAAGADAENLTVEGAEVLLKGSVFRQLQTSRPAELARAAIGDILQRLTPAATGTSASAPGASGHPPAVPPPGGATATPPSRSAADQAETGRHGDARDPAARAATDARIAALRSGLRPLNLYFGWAEVRKLRSQLQLIDDEQREGRDPDGLVDDAEAQLELVHRKVEDHLVLQASDLADLEESLGVVAGLGGQRVRRLESLIATVREAQSQRTIAEGEVERAQKLARDLRKLVESSVLDEGEAPPDLGRGDGRRTLRRDGEPARRERPGAVGSGAPANATPGSGDVQDEAHVGGDAGDVGDDVEAAVAGIDPSTLTPEVHERLLALDVDGERRALDTLASRYAEVVRYAPAHSDAFADIRAAHAFGRPASAALADLERALKSEEAARRDALRREFQALRDDLEALADDTDVIDVRRAIHVVLDVVDEALPALDDVTAARDLHAEVIERAASAQRATQDAERRRTALLEQRDALRGRLDAALARAPEGLPDAASEPLRDAWIALRDARARIDDDGAVDPALLEQARDVEAAWERVLAETSDDRYERLRARARELAARLEQLPDLPSLDARRAALQPELTALDGLPDLTPAHVRTLGSIVDQLFDDARAACARRLEELGREAGDTAPAALLRSLQAAARTLESGAFPDLSALEAEVRAAGDERRTEARRRYLRARQEARRLLPAATPATAALEDTVGRARDAVDGDGDPNEAVADLEALLATIEAEVAERLDAFGGRLDAALARFRQVARLNNDDVAATRRVLTHLDGQRDAVGRVSLGLQARLFTALGDAEARLDVLQEAFEATRAIADQLVAGNLLDDVLGGFDALFGGDAANAGAAGAGVEERLTASWAPYLDLDGVAGAVVLDGAGTVRAGRAPSGQDAAALAPSLIAAHGSWTHLGDRLDGDAHEPVPEAALVDAGGPPVVVVPLADAGYAVVWTAGAKPAAAALRKLRDDRARLVELLREASGEPPAHGPA